jgi:hypothetical protein
MKKNNIEITNRYIIIIWIGIRKNDLKRETNRDADLKGIKMNYILGSNDNSSLLYWSHILNAIPSLAAVAASLSLSSVSTEQGSYVSSSSAATSYSSSYPWFF